MPTDGSNPSDEQVDGHSRRDVLKTGAMIAGASAVGIPLFSGSALATGCALSPGYWKNHPDEWTWNGEGMGHVFLGTAYTSSDDKFYYFENENSSNPSCLEILHMPTKGDKTIIMAQQYIAAVLNGKMGVQNWCIQGYDGPRGVGQPDRNYDKSTDYELLAQEFFDEHPFGSGARHWDGYEYVKDALDTYNNGGLCGCSGDGSTS